MGKMKINILGAHNTETARTRHTCLLIDDIIAVDAGALTSYLSNKTLAKLKAVILTHAHYDHIRDIPALAINLYLKSLSMNIYTHQNVWDNLTTHLLNDIIYPAYHKKPADNPTLNFCPLEPLKAIVIEGYRILPVKVNHSVPAVGYQITSPEGKSIFYTGDTGGGLAETWKTISPELLFVEVTASNRWKDQIKNNGHITPYNLQEELTLFHELKGYFPHIFVVHINPGSEKEIKAELKSAGENLGVHISIARERMQIQI